VPAVGLANFSWDWVYRHLAARQPTLAASADRAAAAYAGAALLLELPFAGDLGAFRRRVQVGLVARRPVVGRDEARRRLGLDGRPAALLSFGGSGFPALRREALGPGLAWLLPEDLAAGRLEALGLDYPDVVAAADVVITKPGYGIVADAVGAGTRLVYTERGDFPEYPIMVRELPRWLAAIHVPRQALLAGRLEDAVARVLQLPMPPTPPLDGAARAAGHLLELLD
jgi:L-arabinokinase